MARYYSPAFCGLVCFAVGGADAAAAVLFPRSFDCCVHSPLGNNAMDELLYFDDLQVGQTFRSHSREVTERDVRQFAELTGDFNPLHVDAEFAAETPFRKPIAHGLLGLSLVAGLSSKCPAVATAAFTSVREWHFQRPIYFGDIVHALVEVVDKHPTSRRRGLIVWDRKLINQDEQVVQCGIFETLVDVDESRKRRKIHEYDLEPSRLLKMKQAA